MLIVKRLRKEAEDVKETKEDEDGWRELALEMGGTGAWCWWIGHCGPPTPVQEQKSAEVVEKKGAIFCRVQKSEPKVAPDFRWCCFGCR